MIEIGQKAPLFTLPDSGGNMVSLADYAGKNNVVLIMYPGDDTEGCTKQLCAIRDDIAEFEKQNAVVLGINHQDPDSHNAFIKKYGLKNPLLIDKGREVIKAYDAIGNFMGNESTKRSVIIIDKAGVIQYIERGLPADSALINKLKEINNN